MSNAPKIKASEAWSEAEWQQLEQRTRQLASAAASEAAAWEIIVRQARFVLRTYSTSFFIVTRFLPPAKRAQGELNYWRWIDSGSYYGIPAQNFLGWFVVSWLIFSALKLFNARSGQPNHWAPSIGLSILLFFTFIALAHHQKLVASIGCGLCLVHLALNNWVNSNQAPGKTQQTETPHWN